MSAGAGAPVCIGEPISWLRLERHRLGELPPAERGAIAAHVGACAACAACLAEAERPLPLPALRPAPAPTLAARLARLVRLILGARPAGRFGRMALVGAAALAAAVILPSREEHRPSVVPAPSLSGVKGGDVAVQLVRERQGAIDHGATHFAPGDRWKALVTCPRERMLFWDLAVLEGGGPPSFPLEAPAPLGCGNRVALPGAFRIDAAGPVEVCVIVADDPIERDAARQALAAPTAADRPGRCTTLWPEARAP